MDKRYSILVVDDEEMVLSALKRLFRDMDDCDVLMTMDSKEALDIVSRQEIDLIVSDQRMPGMPGVLLLKRIKEISPDTVRILMSGYSDFNTVVDAINDAEVYRFISKPWDNKSFLLMVRAALMVRKIDKK